ncbi:MAG: hypothetical protein EOR84_22695 [Mesorhizobium sp.]|uniref:hypothetical protein n=1 Tax=Mesorhizobium sp. TaxID=1871066 RepID=UPI000FE9B0A3|nr:hypothetical protein [Mesorhizobium sp.]RWM90021.1 MAG: hypothetical protein EOR84_22695 [Mesorhizobium sp.]
MSDNLQVRDANGALVTMRTREVGGVHYPAQAGYDPTDDMMKVKSLQKKFRDTFGGAVTDKWDVTNSGMTPTQSAGVLTVASGVTPGAFYEIATKETFTVPCRIMIAALNARHANNHHIFELFSVDPVTGLDDGKNTLQIDIGGAASATVTQMKYATQGSGLAPLESAVATILTTAAYSILEMEPCSDEAYFHSRAIDSTAARSNSYVRHLSLPDPNALYKFRVRSMNHAAWKLITNAVAGTGGVIRLTCAAHGFTTGATVWVEALNGVLNGTAMVRGNYIVTSIDANTFELQATTFAGAYVAGSGRAALGAAPTTVNLALQFVSIQDYAELTAEITAGRGQIVAGQSIGVQTVAGSLVTLSGTNPVNATSQDNVFYNESVAAQAAAATLTGTTRDTAVAAGTVQRYGAFNAFAFADQPGTMRIEVSNDNATWRRATVDTAVAANTPVLLKIPVMTRYHRVVYVNGATLQTAFMLNTAYTAN